jgi:hypothetical protein
VLGSPLIISADVRTLADKHPECLAMLKNTELLAMSQDALGVGGRMVWQRTNASNATDPDAARTTNIVAQVFARAVTPSSSSTSPPPSSSSSLSSSSSSSSVAQAVALFNRAETASVLGVSWQDIFGPGSSGSTCAVRDVWAGKDLGPSTGGVNATVQPHAVVLLKVTC